MLAAAGIPVLMVMVMDYDDTDEGGCRSVDGLQLGL